MEDSYNENFLEITQDTYLKRAIIDMLKEIKEYKEHMNK